MKKYYVNITQKHPLSSSAETQFSVAYGHINGSGSDCEGGTGNDTTLQGETEVVYKQFANLLLKETEVTGGFKISQAGSAGQLSARDADIYVLVGKRARFKDRINKGTWTLALSGSKSTGSIAGGTWDAGQLKLTDDSNINDDISKYIFPRLDAIKLNEYLEGYKIKYNVNDKLFYMPINIHNLDIFKLYDYKKYLESDITKEDRFFIIHYNKNFYELN